MYFVKPVWCINSNRPFAWQVERSFCNNTFDMLRTYVSWQGNKMKQKQSKQNLIRQISCKTHDFKVQESWILLPIESDSTSDSAWVRLLSIWYVRFREQVMNVDRKKTYRVYIACHVLTVDDLCRITRKDFSSLGFLNLISHKSTTPDTLKLARGM